MLDIFLSATGIGATLLACGAAIVPVIIFRRAYQQQSAAMSDANVPLPTAYKALSMQGVRFARLMIISSLLVIVAAVFLLSAQAIYPRIFVFVGISLCIIVAPCLILPRVLFDVLATFSVDNPALAEFQGSDLRPVDVIVFSLRSVFLGQCANDRRYSSILTTSLSSFLLFETSGMLFLLNLQRYLWLIPTLAVFFRILAGLARNHTLKWITRFEPLAQTSWAALEPRIRQLAALAGVEIGRIHVQSMMRIGSAAPLVYGLRRPTLLLTDSFLKNSDWRQQDALVAMLLVLLKKRALLITMLCNLVITATFWIFVVTCSSMIAMLDVPGSLSTVLPVFYSICVLCLLLIALKVFLKSKQLSRYRAAMDLTGDPQAVLVAIQTSGLLTTMQPSRYAWESKRMRQLEQIARQAGRRTPWANKPVPSIVPLNAGSQRLTIPLEQAPPPESFADTYNLDTTSDFISVLG